LTLTWLLTFASPLTLSLPSAKQADGEDHQHDSTVTSVSIQQAGELHLERLNTWQQDLMSERGTDIFRSKGVLSLAGSDEMCGVLPCVHSLSCALKLAGSPKHSRSVMVAVFDVLDAPPLMQRKAPRASSPSPTSIENCGVPQHTVLARHYVHCKVIKTAAVPQGAWFVMHMSRPRTQIQ